MAAPRAERRLAAILAADVVGYSRLMERDEAGTLERLKVHRKEFVEPLIAEHRGRVVKLMGDGALCEFASVVDAVACAVAIQRGMAEREAAVPEAERIRFRIGINLGDIIYEADGDIYGGGVNIAARLEALSPPGGIAVSAMVREQVGNHGSLGFVDLGERLVKAGDRPLRVFTIDLPVVAAPTPVVIAMPPIRPSIAVLPFENLSRDPDQDYFSEGVAEDLITDLSKISGLHVAARRYSFAVRQTARDAMDASTRLQVAYVLEGSVRRAGDRVRITARLVNGTNGGQIWAERYDRTLTDIFAVQDDITNKIVAALQVNLQRTEKEALAQPPTTNLEAYSDYLRGLELLAQHIKPSYELARRMFARAVDLDPHFARALAGIAECDCNLYLLFGASVSFDDILATTARAAELEPSLASPHAVRGIALLATGQADEAERSFQRAISAQPDYAMAHYYYGRACVELGRKHDALQLLRRAADLIPNDVGFLCPLLALYLSLGMTAEAEATAREAVARCERELAEHPDLAVAAWTGACALALLGERERAVEWTKRSLAIDPEDHQTLYNVACTYSQIGLLDEAIDLLERAMLGVSAHRVAWMREDGDLDPLRAHPRYLAFLDRLQCSTLK